MRRRAMLHVSDEEFAGFRVRGLYDPWERAWRIKIWPADGSRLEHDYWVRDGELFTVKYPPVSVDNYWRRSTVGGRAITMSLLERNAILHLISKWEFLVQNAGD
jgi:hypothetical protein